MDRLHIQFLLKHGMVRVRVGIWLWICGLFISLKLDIGLYEKRVSMAGDCEGNGFELWRQLFVQFEGGDEVMKLDGRTNLQNFPVITTKVGITDVLRDWRSQMFKYGDDIGEATKRTMLLKILPEDIRQDALKNKIYEANAIIDHVIESQAFARSDQVLRKRKGAVSSLLPQDAPTSSAAGPVNSVEGVTPGLVAAIVAAIQGTGPRRPPKRFSSKAAVSEYTREEFFPKGCVLPLQVHGSWSHGEREDRSQGLPGICEDSQGQRRLFAQGLRGRLREARQGVEAEEREDEAEGCCRHFRRGVDVMVGRGFRFSRVRSRYVWGRLANNWFKVEFLAFLR